MTDCPWGIGLLSQLFKTYDIRCIGVGSRLPNESEITLTLALYDDDEELAFDSRLQGTIVFPAAFGPMRLCILYPGSGCGVIVEHGAIAYAEDGPNGFAERGVLGLTGKQALVLAYEASAQETNLIVIVWHQEPKTISSREIKEIVKRMQGLNLAFC